MRRQAKRAAGAAAAEPGAGGSEGGEDGGRAQRPATVQHSEEGDCGERGRSDLRRVLLAQECEDQLRGLGVSPARPGPGGGGRRRRVGRPRGPLFPNPSPPFPLGMEENRCSGEKVFPGAEVALVGEERAGGVVSAAVHSLSVGGGCRGGLFLPVCAECWLRA